jgi:hypothetical protein
MRIRVVPALVLGIALHAGCMSSGRPSNTNRTNSVAGEGGSDGDGGAGGDSGHGGGGGSGGATSTGGSAGNEGTGGTGNGGGSGAMDASQAAADSSAPDGRSGSGDGQAGPPKIDGFDFTGCMTVMSGLTTAQFCGAYEIVCGFGKPGRFASAAACTAKFKGGSSDSDACIAGKLCNAANGIKDKELNCKMAAYMAPCMRGY